MSIYMKLDSVSGESKKHGHEGWIELLSFAWGGSRALSSGTGGTYGKQATLSAMLLKEVTVSREADASTPLLWAEMARNATTTAKFHWVRTGGDGGTANFLEAEFRDARILAITETSHGNRPTETILLGFTSMEFKVLNVGDDLRSTQDVVAYSIPDHLRS